MGHTYITELTFSFENMEDIGYAIDFKEIKRVFIEFLQVYMDHGMILNPHDFDIIKLIEMLNTKIWLMSLNGAGNYCNPTVENIAKEVFLSMELISNILYFNEKTKLKIHNVKIYETPNCWTDCNIDSITDNERINFVDTNLITIREFCKEMGIIEYDERKL